MIFEHRAYTMKPGNLERFYELQVERGFEPVAPIMERLIGYFTTVSGPSEQVVHLYAFDSLDDWMTRLHGLYPVEALWPYFEAVRPLMLHQENRLLLPAPLADLNPHFTNEQYWTPADPPLADPKEVRDIVVEERIVRMVPGGVPHYWKMLEAHGLAAMSPLERNRIGTFWSVAGPLHLVHHYWFFDGFDDRRRRHNAVAMNPQWARFQEAIRPYVAWQESKLMVPAPVSEMVPLFRTA